MTIIRQLFEGDYRKPTAVSHIRHPLSPRAIPILEACCVIVQLSEKNEKEVYTFPKKLVKILRGWGRSNNSEAIFSSFDELYKNDILWNYLEKDKTVVPMKGHLLTHLGGHDTQSRNVYFAVNEKLEKIIKRPESYGKPEVLMMFILARPVGAYPLYSVLIDTLYNSAETIDIDLNFLKNLCGVNEEKYPKFRDLNRRHIKPMIERINEQSNIYVEYKTYREGRNIAGVRFHSSHQSWQMPLLIPAIEDLADLLEEAGVSVNETAALMERRDVASQRILETQKLPELWQKAILQGLNEKQAHDLYATGEYAADLVTMILKKIKEYEKRKKIINRGGVYFKAFKEKWGLDDVERGRASVLRKKQNLKKQEEEERKTRRRDNFYKRRNEKLQKIFDDLSETKKKEVLESLEQSLTHYERRSYKVNGLKSKVVLLRLRVMLAQEYLPEGEREFQEGKP